MKSKVFNTEMVQAILKGDKTQFREPIKPKILDEFINLTWNPNENICYSPYQVGDTIFVKETFKLCKMKKPIKTTPSSFKEFVYLYKADNIANSDGSTIKWKPALYMPKEAARIFLKIKDIKVQKVQDIIEDEVFKEGIVTDELEDTIQVKEDIARGLKQSNITVFETNYYREAFKEKWNNKYQSRGYGWNENSWVWCVEFEIVEKSEANGYR